MEIVGGPNDEFQSRSLTAEDVMVVVDMALAHAPYFSDDGAGMQYVMTFWTYDPAAVGPRPITKEDISVQFFVFDQDEVIEKFGEDFFHFLTAKWDREARGDRGSEGAGDAGSSH